jgi:hypothetical protein
MQKGQILRKAILTTVVKAREAGSAIRQSELGRQVNGDLNAASLNIARTLENSPAGQAVLGAFGEAQAAKEAVLENLAAGKPHEAVAAQLQHHAAVDRASDRLTEYIGTPEGRATAEVAKSEVKRVASNAAHTLSRNLGRIAENLRGRPEAPAPSGREVAIYDARPGQPEAEPTKAPRKLLK